MDEDRIRAEKDREITRLKATIAEVVQENSEMKKNLEIACRGGNSVQDCEKQYSSRRGILYKYTTFGTLCNNSGYYLLGKAIYIRKHFMKICNEPM